MFSLASILCLAASLVPTGEAQPPASPPELPPFGIHLHVAATERGPVVDDAWLTAQVERANTILEPYGLTFVRTGSAPMGSERARIESRRDRHMLGALVEPRVINCFVVESLRDVDSPESFIRGVHWRSLTHRGRHYVILSQIAAPGVLAHELGHFFGNHRHSDVPGNLMSYLRGERPPFLDAEQSRVAWLHARRFLATGELVPADRLLPED